MNKAQIKAELRRSAMEDAAPQFDVAAEALDCAAKHRHWPHEFMADLEDYELRIFFLLVAEANHAYGN